MSTSASFNYREGGTLPNGTKLPDIPVMTLLLVRADVGKAAVADGLVDTGFDGAVYSSLELASFLSGMRPTSTTEMESPGHRIEGEVFEVPTILVTDKAARRINLGNSEVFVPLDPLDLTEDIVIGRRILNRLKILLDGPRSRLRIQE